MKNCVIDQYHILQYIQLAGSIIAMLPAPPAQRATLGNVARSAIQHWKTENQFCVLWSTRHILIRITASAREAQKRQNQLFKLIAKINYLSSTIGSSEEAK